jgi:hypothetical protein
MGRGWIPLGSGVSLDMGLTPCSDNWGWIKASVRRWVRRRGPLSLRAGLASIASRVSYRGPGPAGCSEGPWPGRPCFTGSSSKYLSAYSDPQFLAAVDAKVGVISVGVGVGNDYGLPSPILLAELSKLDLPVRRTDRDGDIAVVYSGGVLSVVSRGIRASSVG